MGFFGSMVCGLLPVAVGQEADQLADLLEAFLLALGEEVGIAGDLRLHAGAAELLHRDFLAEHRLDDFRPGDEHLGDLVDDEDEVGQRRRIDGAAGAGPEDDGDLGNDAGSQGVAVEDLAVAGQRVDAFLDARAAGVVDADDRDAHLDGVIHDLGDLARVHQAERTAGHGEVLRIDADRAAVDRAGAGDDAVGGKLLVVHAEILAVVLDEQVVLMERAFIEQRGDPLACGHLAAGLLLADGLVAAAF